MDATEIAARIDQTLLSPTVGFAAGAGWIEAQLDRGYATLCVSPFLVPVATQRLMGSTTGVCSVCGFPFGYTATESKAEEAAHLVELGCDEIDMVANIPALLEDEYQFVRDDIAAVVAAVTARSEGRAIVKVILETGRLDDEHIIRGSITAEEAGAAYVKTSSGFGPRGASVRDVELIRSSVSDGMGVKAAGGIRDLDAALAMLEAGATRLGTSAGDAIIDAASAARTARGEG